MTVPIENCETTYTGNGVTISYSTVFYYLASSELRVTVDSGSGEVLQTLGVDYTATDPSTSAGESGLGNVIFSVAPAAAAAIKIQRKVPYTNPTALRSAGTFAPGVHEDSFDELTYQTQQLDRRLKLVESAGAAGSVVAGNGLSFSSATNLDVNVGAGIVLASDQVQADFTGGAPANVTASAASAGVSNAVSRADHKHSVTAAAAGAITPGASASAGVSTSLALADHVHSVAAATAPSNVTKSAAAVGTSISFARADHKHDVDTAAAATLTDVTNAEGTSTSLARSDHTHSHGARGGGTLHVDATTATSGFMSAADKVKLDALAAESIEQGTVQTTDATPKTILQFEPATNTVEVVTLMVAGKKSGAGTGGGYFYTFCLMNQDGTLSQVGTTYTAAGTHESDAAWNVDVLISSPSCIVRVTGVAATTINWQAAARRLANA